jgi:hypothetical protein
MFRLTYWTVGTIVVLAVPTAFTVIRIRQSFSPEEPDRQHETGESESPQNIIDPKSLL